MQSTDQLTTLFADWAYLHDGWAENVRFIIEDGLIESIDTRCSREPSDAVVSIVIPGVVNAHSHAFQRALAGHTEHRSLASEDNFWSWRVLMYRLANRIDCEAQTVVARQAYTDMLKSGYTTVVEFHYLHGDQSDNGNVNDMFHALERAAIETNIRLVYVPILYERAGFEQSDPAPEQRRFAMDVNQYSEHVEYVREASSDQVTVGVGAHSLRAVNESSLPRLTELANHDNCPIHIHISEQTAEVEQCLEWHRARPVEWLMNAVPLNQQWCLVHATHISDEEMDSLVQTKATVCLCPTTEANLGDGLFPLRSWLERQGNIAIGSDSHITINPFEELRWLEYGQRLFGRSRNISAVHDLHTGTALFNHVLHGGARAAGFRASDLRPGAQADLVSVNALDTSLAGHSPPSLLDALVFTGNGPPIDRVMVGGKWCVVDGSHVNEQSTGAEYRKVVQDFWVAN